MVELELVGVLETEIFFARAWVRRDGEIAYVYRFKPRVVAVGDASC